MVTPDEVTGHLFHPNWDPELFTNIKVAENIAQNWLTVYFAGVTVKVSEWAFVHETD